MRRLLPILAAILLFPSSVSHAQAISIYATSSSARFSNVQTGNIISLPPSPTPLYTNFWTSGIGGGVTFGILPVGPIHIGLDLRGSTRPGTNGADTAFAGFRIGIKPPFLRIKPYLQASGGYIATRTVNTSKYTTDPGPAFPATFYNQYAAYEILGGIDYPLLPILDLRVFELGGGQGYSVNGTSIGSSQISLFTVNTGLVLHF